MLNQIISAKGSSFVLAIGQESGRMEHLDIAIGNLGQWNTIPGHIEVVTSVWLLYIRKKLIRWLFPNAFKVPFLPFRRSGRWLEMKCNGKSQ